MLWSEDGKDDSSGVDLDNEEYVNIDVEDIKSPLSRPINCLTRDEYLSLKPDELVGKYLWFEGYEGGSLVTSLYRRKGKQL